MAPPPLPPGVASVPSTACGPLSSAAVTLTTTAPAPSSATSSNRPSGLSATPATAGCGSGIVLTSRGACPADSCSTARALPSEANAQRPPAVIATPNGELGGLSVVMAVAEAGRAGADCTALVQPGARRLTTVAGLVAGLGGLPARMPCW